MTLHSGSNRARGKGHSQTADADGFVISLLTSTPRTGPGLIPASSAPARGESWCAKHLLRYHEGRFADGACPRYVLLNMMQRRQLSSTGTVFDGAAKLDLAVLGKRRPTGHHHRLPMAATSNRQAATRRRASGSPCRLRSKRGRLQRRVSAIVLA